MFPKDITSESGVQYFGSPPPCILYRATLLKYAERLINNGEFYLRNWTSYRNAEGSQKDVNEGVHKFQYCGTNIVMPVENAAYLWCATTVRDEKELFSHWPEYDTIIQINCPDKLFAYASSICTQQGVNKCAVLAGHVRYDRGDAVCEWPAFACAVFQKGKEVKYQKEKEYRFALVANVIPNCTPLPAITLQLDRNLCRDVVSIIAKR